MFPYLIIMAGTDNVGPVVVEAGSMPAAVDLWCMQFCRMAVSISEVRRLSLYPVARQEPPCSP